MARAVLGPLLTDLRGKLGDSVFDNYKGIHIVRSMPSVITNPQTAYQTAAREALTAFVSAWRGLSLAQKQAWEQIASQMIKGQESQGKRDRGCLIPIARGPFSAYNAFVSCNMNRHSSGFSDIDEVLETAPDGIQLPEPLKSFSAEVTANGITASWEYINPGPRFERLEIWIRSTGAKIHRQLVYTEERNADGSTEIISARGRLGVVLSLPTGVYSLQARIINKFGFTTAPSELAFVQIGGTEMFTYLAVRSLILDLPAAGASIADTAIDLSALVPDGAHTVILSAVIKTVVPGAAGMDVLNIYNTVAQGVQGLLYSYGGIVDYNSDAFYCPCSIDRHIRYNFTHAGAGHVSGITVYLLGYIE